MNESAKHILRSLALAFAVIGSFIGGCLFELNYGVSFKLHNNDGYLGFEKLQTSNITPVNGQYSLANPQFMPRSYDMVMACQGLPIKTYSMSPVIDCGDIVVIASDFKDSELVVGNIIVYKFRDPTYGNMTISHRIISRTGDSFITKGDNNALADPVIKKSDIVGLVVGVIYQ